MVLPGRLALTLLLAQAVALVAGVGEARAQAPAPGPTVRIAGRVRDASTGNPVPEARVWLMTGSAEDARIVWSGFTDRNGSWASSPVAVTLMDLQVEALGYRTATAAVGPVQGGEVSVRVDLFPTPLEMDPLVVVSQRQQSRLETSGFNQRRRQGQGFSITREEFEYRHPARASDVFRLLPGVSVQLGRRGGTGELRYRGCSPDLVLDGVPLVGATSVDDIVSVMDIEAIEVQSGVMFPSRGMGSACGTVMIWTREGDRDELGRPMTWRRAAVAAGFVLLAVLLTR